MPHHAALKGGADYLIFASEPGTQRRKKCVTETGSNPRGTEGQELTSIVWEVGVLGDESELGEHFPELRKLAERASDLLDELFGDFSLQDPPDPDVIVGFSDETIEDAGEATTRLSQNLAGLLLKEFGH